MAVTITNTNYNGDVIKTLYKVIAVGNQVIQKGVAKLETGISTKRAIPRIQLATNPLGAYEVTPTADTADTDYAERQLTMVKAMLRETIDPTVWHDIWDEFKSVGANLTNLALNPQIFSAVMDLYKNGIGTQMSDEFWNGTTFITGIIPLMQADANVIDVANAGTITTNNVFDILQSVWDAIPNHLIDDPNMKIYMSTTDWRKAQAAQRIARKDYLGSLDTEIGKLFLSNRIEHFSAIPENTIVSGKGTTGDDSNFIFGFFAEPDAELGAPRIVRAATDSDAMVIRANFKLDANYRWGGELVLYQGS